MKTINKITNSICSSAGIFAFACGYLLLAFAGFNIFSTGTAAVTLYSNILKAWGIFIVLCSLFNRKRYKLDWINIISIIFVIIFIGSCFISKDYGGLLNNIKGILWIFAELVVLFLIIRENNDKKWINRFFIVLIVISSINTIISLFFAIVGYLYIPPLINNNFYWAGMCSGRLYGFYTDPNYGGNIAAITIFALWYNFFTNKKTWKIVLFVFLSLIQLIFISLTGSRTTLTSMLIAFFILIFAIVIFKFKLKNKISLKSILTSLLCAVISCLVIFGAITAISITYERTEPYILKALNGPISDPAQLFPRQFANKVCEVCDITPVTEEDAHYTQINNSEKKNFVETDHIGLMGRDESKDLSNNRFDLWKSAIQIWKTSPIIGVGHANILEYAKVKFPNCRMVTMNQTTSHNIILDVLAGHGILGLIAFISILILCLYYAFRTLLKVNKNYLECYLIICSVLTLIFISALFYPEILYANTVGIVVFWYLLGHLRTIQYNTIGIKSIKIWDKNGKSKN